MNSDMASFEKINYLLRPNKSVERKMVCEMLSGISAFKDLSTYQYIGFGSTYFADFSLFHRSFGINKMISIESVEEARQRCEFNKPFSCIELKIGLSSTILPNLNINNHDCIVWLDYDGLISDSVFFDINTIFTQMRPDSFFLMSVNAEISILESRSNKDKVDKSQYLKDLIGEDRFPNMYIDKPINKKQYIEILYTCITQQIAATLNQRNGMEDTKVVFRQTANFEYRDGTRMLTIGGFLFEADKANDRLSAMNLHRLPFYRDSIDTYCIQCPVLSVKEIQTLNTYLPCTPMNKENNKFEDEKLNDFPVNNVDIDNYSSLYRYFPNFAETIL